MGSFITDNSKRVQCRTNTNYLRTSSNYIRNYHTFICSCVLDSYKTTQFLVPWMVKASDKTNIAESIYVIKFGQIIKPTQFY